MESTLKKGDKVVMMGVRRRGETFVCKNNSYWIFIDKTSIDSDTVEIVELEGFGSKAYVSHLKKIDPTILTDEELALMVTDIFQPAVDAVKKLANAMHAVAEPVKPKSNPSLRAFLQKLANKHNVTFCVSQFTVDFSVGVKPYPAETFFGFNMNSFKIDCLEEFITPNDLTVPDGLCTKWFNCKCNINPNMEA